MMATNEEAKLTVIHSFIPSSGSRSFSGTLRITEIASERADFTEELENPNSDTFKSLATDVEKTVRNNR